MKITGKAKNAAAANGGWINVVFTGDLLSANSTPSQAASLFEALQCGLH